MRPDHRTDDVKGVADVRHPVTDGLVGRVFQGAGAARHGDDLGPQQLHAEHVQRLPPHVFLAHVDDASEAEQRRRRRRGDAVLARAGLGDDALLAHAFGEQCLPDGVVDFVRARVVEVFAFEVNLRAAAVVGQVFREVKQARAADEGFQVVLQLGLEDGVSSSLPISCVEFVQRRDEGFGHVAPAVNAEAPAFVG